MLHYQGKLYRALNPIYAREPLSGRGAELYGGRFNPKGVPALYTSLSIMTALREANQVGNLQPTALVSYDADMERVFDSRKGAALRAEGTDAAMFADTTWRDQMKANGEAETQAFARRLDRSSKESQMSEANKATLRGADAAITDGDHEGFLHCCTDDTGRSRARKASGNG